MLPSPQLVRSLSTCLFHFNNIFYDYGTDSFSNFLFWSSCWDIFPLITSTSLVPSLLLNTWCIQPSHLTFIIKDHDKHSLLPTVPYCFLSTLLFSLNKTQVHLSRSKKEDWPKLYFFVKVIRCCAQ